MIARVLQIIVVWFVAITAQFSAIPFTTKVLSSQRLNVTIAIPDNWIRLLMKRFLVKHIATGDASQKFNGIAAFFFALAKVFGVFPPHQNWPPAKLLDIGAGDGTFAKTAAGSGYQVFATEIAGPAAERLLNRDGIAVEIGEFQEPSFPKESFDVITFWHVLEHLRSLQQLSDSCSRLLNQGQILIAVPNIQSWQARFFRQHWFHWDPPRHIFLPSEKGLVDYMEKRGFRLIKSHHFFFQYNVFGWQQSLLNLLGCSRDELFSTLKSSSKKKSLLLQCSAYSYLCLTFIPAVFLAVVESISHRGGTVLWVFEKKSLG